MWLAESFTHPFLHAQVFGGVTVRPLTRKWGLGQIVSKYAGGCHHRESKPHRVKASVRKAHNKAKWFSSSVRRREQEALRQMPPTPRITGRRLSAPSLGVEEVGEPNEGKCSIWQILAGRNQPRFDKGKLQTIIGTQFLELAPRLVLVG